MKKRTNSETVMQIIILVLTAFFLLYGMISGKVNKFVHPRFHIGLWISIIVLLLFAIGMLTERKKGRHNANVQQYCIFLIPLIFALIFPSIGTSNVDIVLAGNKPSVNADNNTQNSQLEEQEDSTYSEDWEDSQMISEDAPSSDVNEDMQEIQETQDTVDRSEIYNTKEVDGTYVIEDDIFADWFMDVYDNLDDFVGQKYQFLAQVYPMEGLAENQFLAGRYLMVCCAADLVGYGIICESDIRSELKEDQWITVKGTIVQCEYDGALVPMLIDVTITDAEVPKVEYIYYNY